VSFLRSGDTAVWTPSHGSLLEFAEGKGLSPPYACRAGHCGSCLTPLRAGRVTYAEPTAWKPGERRGAAVLRAAGRTPRRTGLGDGAGTVVAIGSGVTRWRVGDRVSVNFFPTWRAGV
jgi:threonine dehydrogenase-like Zn-dependent dehydrogenase